jgi:hypothetical protein
MMGGQPCWGRCDFAIAFSSDELSQQSIQQLESMSQFEQELAAVDAITHRKKLERFQESQMEHFASIFRKSCPGTELHPVPKTPA